METLVYQMKNLEKLFRLEILELQVIQFLLDILLMEELLACL